MYENFSFRSRERRYRILSVSAELLLNALFSPRRDGDTIRVVRLEGLPEGCEVQAVMWCDLTCVFKLRLWHESFDVVPDGEMCPSIWPLCGVETLRVATDEPKVAADVVCAQCRDLLVGRLAQEAAERAARMGGPVTCGGCVDKQESKPPRRGYEFL